MNAFGILSRQTGSASVEFALILPLLMVLLFGGIEAGHFVWTQHKLVEAVRDGARFAGRLPIREVCEGDTDVMTSETENNIILLTRTGQIASDTANAKVPGWAADQVTVEPNCGAYVTTGLYAEFAAEYAGAGGPVIVVQAQNVAYPWMFGALGSMLSGISGGGSNALDVRLSASSISPGIGL